MQKKSLEVCCYVAGAGAFGVFLRWLQDQLAFNELHLADKSVFHVLVVLFVAAAAYVFLRFIDRAQKEYLYVPESFTEAFRAEGRLYRLLRRVIGGLMVVGALVLFFTCETDKMAGMLRFLAILALLSGVAFPMLLAEANREDQKPGLLCVLSFLPVLTFAVWLVSSYRANSINSVPWSYVLEIATASMGMVSFFRLAGFAFGNPKGWRCWFDAMFGALLCLMSLADERYMGMQIILFSAAAMQILYTWIIVKNLKQGKAPEKRPEKHYDDGFEHLR